MIARVEAKERIVEALDRAPVCCLLGPRQCGKTTIARSLAATRESHYFDLESPRDLLRLTNPEMALEELSGLVVLDEIQERPDIFPVLRVLADRIDSPAKFLLLGSASPELIRRRLWQVGSNSLSFMVLTCGKREPSNGSVSGAEVVSRRLIWRKQRKTPPHGWRVLYKLFSRETCRSSE